MRMQPSLPSLTLFALALILNINSIGRSDDKNPLYLDLVSKGLMLPDGSSLPISRPTLLPQMSALDQTAALQSIAEPIGFDRFTKESNVSPFIFKVEPVKSLEDGSQVQQVDVWFIAYGSIDDVESKKLLEEIGKTQQKPSDLPESARELTDTETREFPQKPGRHDDGSHVHYSFVQASLLEKVHLAVVTSSHSTRSPQSLCIATRLDPSLASLAHLECRWAPIEENAEGQASLGTSSPYAQAAGYSYVTQIHAIPNALLVEMHILFVEPEGWFHGRNLLRSKLPPVIQDAVRTFRRKLAQ